MAIAFALTRPFMTSVIIGATSMEQLKTDIWASSITLSPEILKEIDAIYRTYPRSASRSAGPAAISAQSSTIPRPGG